tara:strand:+ start:1908 stop:2354 length:447 start_codon:yes stop_codon:yes gene_type:complete
MLDEADGCAAVLHPLHLEDAAVATLARCRLEGDTAASIARCELEELLQRIACTKPALLRTADVGIRDEALQRLALCASIDNGHAERTDGSYVDGVHDCARADQLYSIHIKSPATENNTDTNDDSLSQQTVEDEVDHVRYGHMGRCVLL